MKLRLVILPPANINRKAVKLAKEYGKKFPHWFIVDGKKLLPHITLFTLDIEKSKLLKVEAEIKSVVKDFRFLNLTLYRYKADSQGWLVWDIKPNRELSKLRNTLYKKLKLYNKNLVPLRRPYEPHITWTKFKLPENARLAIKGSESLKEKFTARIVALTPYDEFSQVPKVLNRFQLT